MKNAIIYLVYCCCLLTSSLALHSQQGNTWYFGSNAGVSFNSSPPIALSDGALKTIEGCATISNENGLLLFYTDGTNVWNRKHQIMANGAGLKGNPSSSNSAIIIPRPGSDSLYYIFTADAAENANAGGYNYSEVDMSIDNGLGDVTSVKNIPLFAPSTEKLTAIRHSNGIDIWVVTHSWGDNNWYTYKIDCNGVSPSPMVSSAGTNYTETFNNNSGIGSAIWNEGSVGCLKASPDGTKIATTDIEKAGWEIFSFDSNTGAISKPLFIANTPGYGIEFSPDSRYVYVASEHWGYDSSFITQYDVTNYNGVSIASSANRIGANRIGPSIYQGSIGALQLGPDNKIYCAIELDSVLAVINFPNSGGKSCNFISNQVKLNGNLCQRGLPVFFPSLLTNQNVNIDFTVDNDCSTIKLSGSSAINGSLSWMWDFGDGTSGTGQTIIHNYPPGSVDTVTLTVSTTSNCGTVHAKAVKQINLKIITPISRFGVVVKCGNSLATFSDSSTVPMGSIQSWQWDFGDGITSNLQHPTHMYANYGDYTVKLLVQSSGNCKGTDVYQKTVSIEPKPLADFSYTNNCIGHVVSFADNSTIAAGAITKWYWAFGNNDYSVSKNPTTIYENASQFVVNLAVSSSTGCLSDTITKRLLVYNNPVAQFNANGGCLGQPISLIDNSSVDTGNITGWNWVFDNSQYDNHQSPSVSFSSYGNHSVKLIVQSDKNCSSDTLSKTITIDAKPEADFLIANGCSNNLVSPENKSSIAFGSIATYYWDFGDGETSQLKQPMHSYSNYGNFEIKIAAVSANGCTSDTVTKIINIESTPVVDFNFGNTCAGKSIQFQNTSTHSPGSDITYKWNFSNGDVSSDTAPAYTYLHYGTYGIILTATTKNGCQASVVKTISIKRVNIFAGKDTILAAGQPLQLLAAGAKNYTWSPAQYLNDPASDHPVAQLPQSFSYYLTGVTEEGCTGYDTINIKVYKVPEIFVPNAFTPNGDHTNDDFKPVLPGFKQLLYFSVYNRWGQLIFSTQEIGKGWNGKLNGIDQPTGTFVWTVKAVNYLGNTITKNGIVLLLR